MGLWPGKRGGRALCCVFFNFWRELMHSLETQASFLCVGKNYFVSMLRWQHLPHLPGRANIICRWAFCIPRNTSLQSQSIVPSFLHYCRDLMHCLVAQGSYSCVGKKYFLSMLPWQHLPHLPGLVALNICWLACQKIHQSKVRVLLCCVFSTIGGSWRILWWHKLPSTHVLERTTLFPWSLGNTFHTCLA